MFQKLNDVSIRILEIDGTAACFPCLPVCYAHSFFLQPSDSLLQRAAFYFKGNMRPAVLDGILHHSTTVNIKGESFRLKDREEVRTTDGQGKGAG